MNSFSSFEIEYFYHRIFSSLLGRAKLQIFPSINLVYCKRDVYGMRVNTAIFTKTQPISYLSLPHRFGWNKAITLTQDQYSIGHYCGYSPFSYSLSKFTLKYYHELAEIIISGQPVLNNVCTILLYYSVNHSLILSVLFL